VPKPFTRKELLSPVLRALRLVQPSVAADDPGPEGEATLEAGDVLFLPHHAWARLDEDGSALVGIEESFLRTAGAVVSMTLPEEVQMVEQGYVGLVLHTQGDESHGVAMPLSGQVVAYNAEAFDDPRTIGPRTWLLRVTPAHLQTESKLLARRA